MPKETFYNLPDEKKKLIEDIAIDVFAKAGYEKATINEIVRRSKIAKGSFYQYFKGKKDLFVHVMELIKNAKLEYLSPVLMNPHEHNFFVLLKEVYISALEFGSKRPELLKISLDIASNRRSEIYEDLIKEGEDQSIKLFSSLIELAIKRGEIKSNVDIHFMAYFITRFSIDLNEYYFHYIKEKMDFEEYSSRVLSLVEKQIDVLKNGIGT